MNLRRSEEDKMLFGVCGGIAAATGVDALIVRIGFAVLTVLGFSGIALYIVLWILMPRAQGGSVAQDIINSFKGGNTNHS